MTSTIQPALEKYFQEYEAQLLNSGPLVNYALWEKEVHDYFDQWWDNPTKIDESFNQFTTIWGFLYQLHRFAEADQFWELPIDFARGWEKTNSKRLHKETP